MNNKPSSNDPKISGTRPPTGTLRSPIRPRHPDPVTDSQPQVEDSAALHEDLPTSIIGLKNPLLVLDILRKKMDTVAGEFAGGKINRAQFNAIYGRYDEQRKIIERIIERNPDSDAWQQVVTTGQTSFLREHFQARCQYYVIYRHNWPRPLMMGGHKQADMTIIEQALASLNKTEQRPGARLARKALDDGEWLVLALGDHAVTLAVFNLEPSMVQLNRVRDLHHDFERANRMALASGTRTLEKMVFPQRALVEGS